MVYKITSWAEVEGHADHFKDAKAAVEAAAEGYMEHGNRLVWKVGEGGAYACAQIYADHEPTDCWWQIEEE